MRLAVIPGDGIGPEVIDEALKVLHEVAPGAETTTYDLGAARWHATGELLPDSVLTELREHDAILLGAVGDPSVPSGILERGLLLRLRFELDHHVNLRPARLYPGVRGPLAGDGGRSTWWWCARAPRARTSAPAACCARTPRRRSPPRSALNTAFGVERVVRDAFERAERRPRKHLTLVHKTNVLTYSGRLWSRIVEEVSLEHPGTSAWPTSTSTRPRSTWSPTRRRFDVIVTDNLFGDILTDLAAAVTGGIGLAASGNLDVSRRNPSMFEPVHGSAPDIAGQGIADPTAAVLSVALLLDHLGDPASAGRVEAAVAFDLATRDHGASGHTRSIGDRLAALVSAHATSDA